MKHREIKPQGGSVAPQPHAVWPTPTTLCGVLLGALQAQYWLLLLLPLTSVIALFILCQELIVWMFFFSGRKWANWRQELCVVYFHVLSVEYIIDAEWMNEGTWVNEWMAEGIKIYWQKWDGAFCNLMQAALFVGQRIPELHYNSGQCNFWLCHHIILKFPLVLWCVLIK